ncbi:MAG: DNA cytosine methyltransferase [Clostridiales Family XIII bacterium]|nr:DNA cytosine methyltransferase [Clostridiales Family XIII bacterium]
MNGIMKATALSLFSGIGGFEVGMSRCGFSFLKTLEWDENCCKTLSQNKILTGTAECEINTADITKTSPEEFYNGDVDY